MKIKGTGLNVGHVILVNKVFLANSANMNMSLHVCLAAATVATVY